MATDASAEALWEKWEGYYQKIGVDPNRICRDGALADYARAPKKVLFVLKEVNSPDQRGWDLRRFLQSGPKYQMWHAVSRWAAGILLDFPPFEEIDTLERMREALAQVAVINLKKTPGGATSNMSVINAYASRDRELLSEQISGIGPEFVVACGTFDILVWLLNLTVCPDHPNDCPLLDETRNAWVIPWCHPGRSSNIKTHGELKMIFDNRAGWARHGG